MGGVCKITVYERGQNGANLGDLRPLAERLIYRQSSDYLHVVIRPEEAAYVPREQVKLHLQTLTEDEAPAPAVMMIAVVDKSVLTLADEKTARTLPTHFLLTSDVRRRKSWNTPTSCWDRIPRPARRWTCCSALMAGGRFAQGVGAAAPALPSQPVHRRVAGRAARDGRCCRQRQPAQPQHWRSAGRHGGRAWSSRLPGHAGGGTKGPAAVPGARCRPENPV